MNPESQKKTFGVFQLKTICKEKQLNRWTIPCNQQNNIQHIIEESLQITGQDKGRIDRAVLF